MSCLYDPFNLLSDARKVDGLVLSRTVVIDKLHYTADGRVQ
jgi:hypothetical protein